LHGKTVADAPAARQVLKTEIKSGKFLAPSESKQKEEKEKAEKVSTEASTRNLRDAVTYLLRHELRQRHKLRQHLVNSEVGRLLFGGFAPVVVVLSSGGEPAATF
jgi:hypothetical protein